MIKQRHDLYRLVLAVICTAAIAHGQERMTGPDALPVITDPKQSERLVVDQAVPVYPAVAKVNYLQGRVQLELTVNGEGKVAKAHVLEGDAILAESALQATRRWTYHPLTTASGTSGFITTVRLKFRLSYWKLRLTPRQAEQDFLRQVKPPQAVRPTQDLHGGEVLHVRLLLNDQGQVDDIELAPMEKAQWEAARESLRGWTFRPAHWGSLPVASYLEVDVPVGAPRVARAASITGGR